jgi:hypothetical protein
LAAGNTFLSVNTQQQIVIIVVWSRIDASGTLRRSKAITVDDFESLVAYLCCVAKRFTIHCIYDRAYVNWTTTSPVGNETGSGTGCDRQLQCTMSRVMRTSSRASSPNSERCMAFVDHFMCARQLGSPSNECQETGVRSRTLDERIRACAGLPSRIHNCRFGWTYAYMFGATSSW